MRCQVFVCVLLFASISMLFANDEENNKAPGKSLRSSKEAKKSAPSQGRPWAFISTCLKVLVGPDCLDPESERSKESAKAFNSFHHQRR
uniref:AlNc14C125G6776 protein n=1 Tax=Albugo laibachii Nc14 TaxID=890382 RepID=F0WJQ0_9STRA|nr:AlNc14C125G6776 [Albugo laibachii Nc14]|eukprot:CCA21501.1 AlNc14C125G6776 [Albugo laibachii Nc14]